MEETNIKHEIFNNETYIYNGFHGFEEDELTKSSLMLQEFIKSEKFNEKDRNTKMVNNSFYKDVEGKLKKETLKNELNEHPEKSSFSSKMNISFDDKWYTSNGMINKTSNENLRSTTSQELKTSGIVENSKKSRSSVKLDIFKETAPIYMKEKACPISVLSKDERLHLYDFEIDINESGTERKAIKRKRRSYKRTPNRNLISEDQENDTLNRIKNGWPSHRKPAQNKRIDNVNEVAVAMQMNMSVDGKENNTPDSKGLDASANRNLNLPLISSFTSKKGEIYQEKLAHSEPQTCKNKNNYSVKFKSYSCLGKRELSGSQTNQFDISNCFGFDDDMDALLPSLEKVDTPKTPFPRKRLIKKPPIKHVINMLKLGTDTDKDNLNSIFIDMDSSTEVLDKCEPIEEKKNLKRDDGQPHLYTLGSVKLKQTVLHEFLDHYETQSRDTPRKSYKRPRKAYRRFREEAEEENTGEKIKQDIKA